LFQEIELAGEELTGNQLIEIFSRVLKQPIHYKQSPPVFFIKLLAWNLYLMLVFFEKKGYKVDITALRTRFPELRTFENWLIERDFENFYKTKLVGWSIW